MASISSSSFHCFSSSHSSSSGLSSMSPTTRVRFQKPRPISAICATVSERSTASFYDVLGVRSGATCQEIKAAYRRLARVLHPDVVAANGQNDMSSADDFIRVHEAYATLSDPGRRADYDRDLVIRRRFMDGISSFVNVSTERGSSVSRFTRRSWETDQCW